MIRRILAAADQFCKRSDWKIIALLKLCVFSLGLLAGIKMPEKYKKQLIFTACIIFLCTYLPLMKRYTNFLLENRNE